MTQSLVRRLFALALCASACQRAPSAPCFTTRSCGAGAGCAFNHQCASRVCSAGACAAPSCGDGVQNGDERGVDCGGACGANCGLGAPCGSGGDCAFGVCASGKCAPPASGPAPTGPAAALIAPDGGTVSAVTAEHVRVTIDFPAGAVKTSLSVKVTPLAPEAGQWARVQLEPAGATFLQPALVTFALPSAVSAAAAGVYFGSADVPLLIASTSAGSAVTAPLASFGFPSGSSLPPGAFGDYTPGSFLAASPLFTLDEKLAMAERLLAGAERNKEYAYAAGIAQWIVAIRQLNGLSDTDKAKVADFLARSESSACLRLRAAMDELGPFDPYCTPELEAYGKPVAESARVLQSLDQPAVCPPFDDSSWAALLASKLGQLANNIQDHRVEYVRCDCKNLPKEQLTNLKRIACGQVGIIRLRLSDASMDGAVSEILPDDYVAAETMVVNVRLLGVPALADALEAGLAKPVEDAVRKQEFELCQADGDTAAAGELLQRVPGDTGVQEDAQYCAATLAYTAYASDDTAGATGTLNVAASGGADDAATTATFKAKPDGRLLLAGPLHALRCPEALDGSAPAQVEADQLVVSVNGVEALRQPADAGGDLLGNATYLAMSDLLAKAGGPDPAKVDHLTLTVSRDSPGCGGLYGAGVTKLFTLLVEPDVPSTLTLKARRADQPAAPLSSTIDIVAGQPAVFVATVLRGDVPRANTSVLFRAPDASGKPTVVLGTVATGPDGVATLTAAANGSFTYATSSEDGQPCAVDSSAPTCHTARVQVNLRPPVQVSPSSAGVWQGATQQFTAKVYAGNDARVTWSVSGGGSIDSSGLFTAGTAPGQYQVTATSAVNPAWTDSVTVQVFFKLSDLVDASQTSTTWSGPEVLAPASGPPPAGCTAGSSGTLRVMSTKNASAPNEVVFGYSTNSTCPSTVSSPSFWGNTTNLTGVFDGNCIDASWSYPFCSVDPNTPRNCGVSCQQSVGACLKQTASGIQLVGDFSSSFGCPVTFTFSLGR